jgi:HPt (histidine-containing phosphotransfer) domain-containing protein
MTASASLINSHELLEEIGGDMDLFQMLIETAQRDLPRSLATLMAAVAQSDYEQIKFTAHAMKTTLAHWKAELPRSLALSMEVNCREGRYTEALATAPAFEAAVNEVLQALAELKEKSCV